MIFVIIFNRLNKNKKVPKLFEMKDKLFYKKIIDIKSSKII